MYRITITAIVAVALFGVGPSSPPAQVGAHQPREIRDLTQALTHASSPDPGECIRGLNALPRFAPAKRDDDVARVISVASNSRSAEVRAAAVRVAGELIRLAPQYQSVCSFPTALGDADKNVRVAALDGLAERGSVCSSDEVAALIRLLKDKDPVIRMKVYGQLGLAGEKACIWRSTDVVAGAATVIIKNLDTESPEESPTAGGQPLLFVAVRSLGRVGRGAPGAVPAFLKVYDRFSGDTKRDAEMRGVVIDALAEIGPYSDKSLPLLAKLMRNEKLPTHERASAVWAIGRFGPLATDLVPDMISLLKTVLKQSDPPRGSVGGIVGAFVWLGEVAEPAIPLLLDLAQGSDDSEVTLIAIQALRDLGPVVRTRAAPILAKLYFAKEKHTRTHDLEMALIKFGDASAPLAIEALKSGDGLRQEKAIELLTSLVTDARPAIPELRKIAADRNHPLRVSAEYALRKIDR